MDAYDPFERGGHAVDVRDVEAHDAARDRTFPIAVWSPAGEPAPSTSPLVVYSHHSGGDRRAASYLCTHLASHGYVVAALDHSEVVAAELALPADGTSEERVEWARQHWVPARVPDVRFLIDRLVDSSTTDRVGIVGHSFGGWTALATPEQDDRIGAVVALAPGGAEPAPPGIIPTRLDFRWGRDVPTMYLVAERDASLPLDGMHQIFARSPAPKRMVILHRADHLHFIDGVEAAHEEFRTASLRGPAAEIQRRMRPISELCSGEQAHRFVCGLTLAHLDAAVRERESAQRFLDRDIAAALASRGVDAIVV